MPSYADLILASGAWIWLLFVFAFGACAGSLINVLVYRLPLGMSVVTPASRCPACGTRLTWRENIPVLGWLVLRGRCRFCKSRISPEYPLVEAFVGLSFVVLFFLWYVVPAGGREGSIWLGVDWGMIRPEWATYDAMFDRWPRQSWPEFIVLLAMTASLIAMSLVDLKTYTIPLQIPWFATAVGLVFHVGHAAYLSARGLGGLHTVPRAAIDGGAVWAWAIPTTTNWWWTGASVGGVLGLLLASVCVAKGWLRRSFADYAEWERTHLGEPAEPEPADDPGAAPVVPSESGFPFVRRLRRFVLVCGAVVAAFGAAGSMFAAKVGLPEWSGLLAGVLLGPLVAGASLRPLFGPPPKDEPPDPVVNGGGAASGPSAKHAPADTWIQYPHARREMVKEILFLTPCIAMAWLGGTVARSIWGGGADVSGAPMPLWVSVLTGVIMGYLIGGGVVWLFRIIGSLGFAKEALGLGDVHLMAAVGACTGWIDATLAFPLAAVVGLYWVIVHAVATRQMPRAMQFGPYLAVATMLVVLGKPLVEMGLAHLLGSETAVNLP